LFISPIKTFPGPPCTATGDPGALTNNGCCDAFAGTSPEGQEINNDVHDAASNRIHRLTLAGILTTKLIARLLSVFLLRRVTALNSSRRSDTCSATFELLVNAMTLRHNTHVAERAALGALPQSHSARLQGEISCVDLINSDTSSMS